MSYADVLAADRRLCILRLIKATPNWRVSAAPIAAALPQFGHAVSHDTLSADLVWLEEHRLITLSEIGGLMVATGTQRGIDVGSGVARHPGVRRPGPDESEAI